MPAALKARCIKKTSWSSSSTCKIEVLFMRAPFVIIYSRRRGFSIGYLRERGGAISGGAEAGHLIGLEPVGFETFGQINQVVEPGRFDEIGIRAQIVSPVNIGL